MSIIHSLILHVPFFGLYGLERNQLTIKCFLMSLRIREWEEEKTKHQQKHWILHDFFSYELCELSVHDVLYVTLEVRVHSLICHFLNVTSLCLFLVFSSYSFSWVITTRNLTNIGCFYFNYYQLIWEVYRFCLNSIRD